MVLLLLFIATGWFYVGYLVCKSIFGLIKGRNEPLTIGRNPQVKSSLYDYLLAVVSAASFIIIIAVFTDFAYDLLTTQDRMVGGEFEIKRKLRPMFFVYGIWFAPASMVAVVYAFYIIECFFGRAKSYAIELSTIPAAGYTVVAYGVLRQF